MVWFKTDDVFYRHRKVRKLGRDKLPAIGLWLLAGSWCADNIDENLTDGFVPREQVESWDPKLRYAKRLVDVELWHEAEHDGEHGFEFHDWAEYQPLRVQVEQQRVEDVMRKDLYSRPGLVSKVKERDGDICRYCGVTVKWSDRRGQRGGTIDHLMPVTRGGENHVDNLVVACRSCNGIKGARTPEEANMPLLSPRARTVTSSGAKSNLDRSQNGTGSNLSPVPGPVPGPSSSGSLRGRAPDSTAGANPRPLERCEKHTDDPHPPPCGKCADARRAAEAWDDAEVERAAQIRRDVEAAIADPRQRCEHGTDGGLFPHPITGKSATCALCRVGTNTREAS